MEQVQHQDASIRGDQKDGWKDLQIAQHLRTIKRKRKVI